MNNVVEIESKSKPAQFGDYVVARNDNGVPAEQYLVTAAKFPTLYNVDSASAYVNGWLNYKVIPQDRFALIWTPELQDLLETIIQDRPISLSQEQLFEIVLSIPFRQFKKAQKQSTVFVRHAIEGEVVITKVIANDSPVLFEFEASWGEKMPVKENDVLIVLQDEVYRIARAEFDLTYTFKQL